nr:hypothetical protein [Tanacetum cinerariifolium]
MISITEVIAIPTRKSFLGLTVHDVSTPIENNLDYVEELARFQRQEYEAHSTAAKHGFEFYNDTAALLHQAAIETRRNLVLATGDPAGSIVSTGGVPAGSVPASGVPAGSLPLSIVSAGGVPAGSVPASGVPAAGIFSSSSYDADFCADVTNLASTVAVDPIATKRVNTIHYQYQIIGDLHHQYRQGVQCRNLNLVKVHLSAIVAKALEDPDWVAAMQEEMQQFYHQQVWKPVPLHDGKIAIGTK